MAGFLSSYFLRKQPSEEDAKSREIVKPSVTLMEWDAPEREFKKHPREYYRKVAVISIFSALILLVMLEFVLIFVVGIVFFVIYVFHTIPPRNVHHQITTNGVNYASEHLYRWYELKSFYIEKKTQHRALIIDTVEPLPGRIILLMPDSVDQEALTKTLNEYISINEEPEEGVLDQLLSKISRRLNI